MDRVAMGLLESPFDHLPVDKKQHEWACQLPVESQRGENNEDK